MEPDEEALEGYKALACLRMVQLPPPLPKRRSTTGPSDLVSSLRQLRDCTYYWGPLSKESAENKLANQPDGAFLLRDSSDDRHFFSLSFRMSDRTHHIRISYSGGMFSFDYLNSLMRRPSILDLVHTTMTQSRNKRVQYFIKPRIPSEPPVPVNILYPISRNDVVHSLLHLCRSTIRGNIRLDHIERLTIPSSLKDYVRDGQYYCEDTVTASPPYDVNRPPPPPPPLSSWRPRGPQH